MSHLKPVPTDAAVPPATPDDDPRLRAAASLFDQLGAPTQAEPAYGTGVFDSETSDWLADASAQAASLARRELDTLETRVGTRVGPYRLTALLGHGGMGAVFAAERSDGTFAQQVALKLIRTGTGGARMASRFRRERAILARLEHPNIARLLDGGLSAEGEPWFAMELIDGVPLGNYCSAHAMSMRQRVEVFLQVCDAVDFAHRNLVVHRDLKPANVLVGQDGRVKLLDFGIAKLIDRTTVDTQLTNADERVLTPDYAAPEQVLGQSVTTATDVYALGLLLFEILTGERAQRLSGKSLLEAERWVVNQEVVRPSSAGGAGAAELRGDLDAIVAKALRKEPAHRYGTVQALGDELRRYLDGNTVQARGNAWSYRAARFGRRYRWGIAAVGGMLLALMVGLGATLWQAREARLQAARADSVKTFLIELFQGVDPRIARQGGREISAVKLLDHGIERMRTQLGEQPADRAELLLTLADMYSALGRRKTAQELTHEALDLMRSSLGSDDPRLVRALSRLAQAAGLQGNMRDAAKFAGEAERLLAGADASYDGDRLGVLQARLVNANRAGDYAESERLAHLILDMQRKRFGEDSPETAIGLLNLAWAYNWQDRYDEADALYRKALVVGQSIPNGSSPRSPHSTSFVERVHTHLGNIASHRGRYRESREHYQKALELGRASVGPEHPFSTMSEYSIAFVDSHLGRAEEGEAKMRKLYVRLNEALGGDAYSLRDWSMAQLLAGRGKIEEADTLIRAQFKKTRADYGDEAKLTQFVARDLGAIVCEGGNVGEARQVLGDAMRVFARIGTTENQQYALAESRFARALLASGDATGAERHARHAHAFLLGKIGAYYDETARAQHELGRALIVLGRIEEGVPHLQAAADNYAGQFGEDDVRTAEFRFVLGEALQSRGESRAEAMLDAAARALVAVEGNTLPVRTRAERWLAGRG